MKVEVSLFCGGKIIKDIVYVERFEDVDKVACWENLQELPSLVSKAREPKTVSYVEIRKENQR